MQENVHALFAVPEAGSEHPAKRRRLCPGRVFGQLKNNRGFRRFLLRGMEKVTLEVGWLSLAHNLLKQATNDLICMLIEDHQCTFPF
ncbi:transposase [Paenibacillus sp. FSL L8-0340]|uniref:transposase n=1 Tax=Paenibacillus sp. FSL L8-0340 TaxID=2954685 RepID=UPI0031595885